MKITQKLETASKPSYSFEYFVPKTTQGLHNLYDRMDRMYLLGPQFIDITWNAGGSDGSHLTPEMVATAQSIYGLETCMHLTCTRMPAEKVDEALDAAYESGCNNILALRGDKPDENDMQDGEDHFTYAVDLVRHIRSRFGDHFDIGVAGYPEGHDEQDDSSLLMQHLKDKVDAGASFIITQMFYDVDRFLTWVQECRDAGITVPIIPGIMPISTYAAFIRRASWCKVVVPDYFMQAIEPHKDDDAKVRDIGADLVADMCRKILAAGITHLHFYTMNLEKATCMILDRLGVTPEVDAVNPLPWRQSLARNRRSENVRPIFWKNRKLSYIARTQDWDEFPNGRWGDSRSPAYGDLDINGVAFRLVTSQKAAQQWGEPKTIGDISALFVKYVKGELSSLPWSDSPISPEVNCIQEQLIELDQRGLLTINCQPAINGVPSSDPVHGWGPKNGYVYQKAYLELLLPPDVVDQLIARVNQVNSKQNDVVTYYCVNNNGDLRTNSVDDGPTAVTWGIFPGKEVVQPTIVEMTSFMAWKDEAYRLAGEWAKCYPTSSPARALIETIAESWCLINIVHNNYFDAMAIFDLFDGISALPTGTVDA
ncbi:hypothetical protein CANCADRAFT_128000 [Tortispora caseinolytica NRRL Y-17796]|uniref:MTHFR SAM-binding regulatory domain-containing protein n=1 Tax=Tortispora caseinolytica NRRL Y-17796 TaxID=767744 RepID=A0A1E4TAE8_9ASCO|nr:hypothetical protein CANCADRAFT_128000 [Tortispora caseinolytica NRRL Y-17796]